MLPNDDQKQLVAAVGRVLSEHAGEWNAQRSGNPLADLRAAKSALAAMVGRGSSTEKQGGSRQRSFWGWGYEGEGPEPLMMEVLLEFIKARFGQRSAPASQLHTNRAKDKNALPPRWKSCERATKWWSNSSGSASMC